MDFDDIKSILFTIVLLGFIALGGYWAFSSMESGSSYKSNQEIETLEEENTLLKEEVDDLKSQISDLNYQNESKKEETVSEQVVTEVAKTETKEVASTETKSETVSTYKYQDLINELQKLVDGNIYMKKGSAGTRIGTVQKFLNIYNGTSNKVDNDYGNATITAVKTFQKKEGLTADGNAGPATFKKMISWLKTK